MNKAIFVSQNDQNHFPEKACGVACLSMMLKNRGLLQDKSFVELADDLRLTVPPLDKGYEDDDEAIGVYPEDLFTFCVEHGIPFRMSFYDDEWKDSLKKGPIMVLLTGNEEEFGLRGMHWVVLLKRDKDFFTYFDPWYKKESGMFERHISAVDFERYYTGIACQFI